VRSPPSRLTEERRRGTNDAAGEAVTSTAVDTARLLAVAARRPDVVVGERVEASPLPRVYERENPLAGSASSR
jgi:hypothetical protein